MSPRVRQIAMYGTLGLLLCLSIGGSAAILMARREAQMVVNPYADVAPELIEDYLNGVAEMTEVGEPDNVLIVIAEERPETYGATKVVAAPDNTYYLMYESEEAKRIAMGELAANPETYVEENHVYELMDVVTSGADSQEKTESEAHGVGAAGVESLDEAQGMVVQTASHYSWGVEAMGMDGLISAVNAMGNAANRVKVAVIDTGVRPEVFRQVYGGRTLSMYDVQSKSTTTDDAHGHGTHVAGIVADATSTNVEVLAIRASWDAEGHFDTVSSNAALIYALNNGADVINMSFGGNYYTLSQKQILDRAEEAGVVNIAASGNYYTDMNYYPASYDNVMSVGAVGRETDGSLKRGDYSNYGTELDFVAPGTRIENIQTVTQNTIMSGTSMAAPHMAAAVAELKSVKKSITRDEAIEILRGHAMDLGDTGWDRYYGWGMVNFANAELCTNGTECDEYGVMAKAQYSGMSEARVVVTPYNYGSIYNVLATEVNVVRNGVGERKKLYELSDVTIEGYDALAVESMVRVNYKDMSIEFVVTNPTVSGWEIVTTDEGALLSRYIDNNMGIPVMYLPESVGGKSIIGLKDGDKYSSAVFDLAKDAGKFTRVVMPETVKYVGVGAFANMEALTDVVMPGVTEVGATAFYGTRSMKILVLPEGLRTIGAYAYGESGVTELYVPASVNAVDATSFYMCGAMRAIGVDEGNMVYDDRGGANVLVESETDTLVRGAYALQPDEDTGEFEVIPFSIKKIGAYAFSGATSLSEIDFLGDELEEIDETAFAALDEYSREADLNVYLGVKSHTAAHKFASKYKFEYYTITYSYIDVAGGKLEYAVGETVEPSGLTVTVKFDYAYYDDNWNYHEMKDADGKVFQTLVYGDANTHGYYAIQYQNGTSFSKGDTAYYVVGWNDYGGRFERMVEINRVGGEDEPEVPDEPEAPAVAPNVIQVGDMTKGVATISGSGTKVVVTSKKPVVIVGTYDGDKTYVRLARETIDEGAGQYAFEAGDLSERGVRIYVVLKGDVNMNGKINTNDSTAINLSLLSKNHRFYAALSPLAAIIADVNENGKVNTNDSTAINLSLLSSNHRFYREIAW